MHRQTIYVCIVCVNVCSVLTMKTIAVYKCSYTPVRLTKSLITVIHFCNAFILVFYKTPS